MKSFPIAEVLVLIGLSSLSATLYAESKPAIPGAVALKPVPFHQVTLSDTFWKPRIDTNHSVSLPMMHQSFVENHNLDNFKKAAGKMEGNHDGMMWADSDVYKTLEGMAYALKVKPDADMEKKLEEAANDIAAAQRKDGYIDTYFQLGNSGRGGDGKMLEKKPWDDPISAHEDYCMGHLMEAAVAHFDTTGKTTLIDTARKNADYLHSQFGPPPKRSLIPGHQEVELGLLRLLTVPGKGKPSDLELTKFYLDERGRHSDGRKLYGEYCQDIHPIREELEPLGHGVRGGYMWAAATDYAVLTGDLKMLSTMEQLWTNVIERKMYVTGGMGSGHYNEGFAPDYDLSHEYAYNETCAACAMIFWTHRLANLRGDGRYTDQMERILYNGYASGRSLDGKDLYYNNFIKREVVRARTGIVCCATNIVRTMPTISGYQYAAKPGAIWTHLYIAGKGSVQLDGGEVALQQATNYPWDGNVKITVTPKNNTAFALHVRVPEWAKGATVKVGDESFDPAKAVKGYLAISRTWKPGDVVELNLPMEPRRIYSHPNVWDDKGRVAIARGPLVYCLESNDNPTNVHKIVISKDATFTVGDLKADELNGIVKIHGKGIHQDSKEAVDFTMIPYAVWDNRTHDSLMCVMALEVPGAKPGPIDMGRTIDAKVSFSHKHADTTETALNDTILPTPWNGVNGSRDKAIPRFTWEGKMGSKEWVAYEFPKPLKIWRSDVFWVADQKAGTDFPETFFYEYWDDAAKDWKPLKMDADYMSGADLYADYHYSVVRFVPVTTSKIRLLVQLKPDKSSGILEWRLP